MSSAVAEEIDFYPDAFARSAARCRRMRRNWIAFKDNGGRSTDADGTEWMIHDVRTAMVWLGSRCGVAEFYFYPAGMAPSFIRRLNIRRSSARNIIFNGRRNFWCNWIFFFRRSGRLADCYHAQGERVTKTLAEGPSFCCGRRSEEEESWDTCIYFLACQGHPEAGHDIRQSLILTIRLLVDAFVVDFPLNCNSQANLLGHPRALWVTHSGLPSNPLPPVRSEEPQMKATFGSCGINPEVGRLTLEVWGGSGFHSGPLVDERWTAWVWFYHQSIAEMLMDRLRCVSCWLDQNWGSY